MNLIKANLVRKQKVLSKLYRFSDGNIMNFRDRINQGFYIKSEIALVSSVMWNRRKFNRMDDNEQKEYEEKLNKKKKEYRLFMNDGSFSIVPFYVYEYFQEWKERRN